MDNGNDLPARIPFLEISDENMIPNNSGLTWHHDGTNNIECFVFTYIFKCLLKPINSAAEE